MTTKHKDHREQSVRVNLKKRKVRLNSKTYLWEDLYDGADYGGREWSRVKNDVLRKLHRHKREDRHLIRKLQRLVEHEESRRDRREKENMEQLRDAVLATENALHPVPDSKSASADDSETVVAGEPIRDNKHGVQLFSNNGKFFFRIAVYKSKKYPGCSSVYLTVAGRRYLYTLDQKNMKALREETAKGMV